MKNGHVEIIIQEYQPENPFFLKCEVTTPAPGSITVVLATLQSGKMKPNSDANLQASGYSGRVSIKDILTIVISNITFKDQGSSFECDLVSTNFYTARKVHTLDLVVGEFSFVL